MPSSLRRCSDLFSCATLRSLGWCPRTGGTRTSWCSALNKWGPLSRGSRRVAAPTHAVLLDRRCVSACMRGRVGECDVNVCLFQNWIGSEAVKRKRKAGILPRPKVDISGVCVCASVCQQLVKLVRCAALTRVTCTFNLSAHLPCCGRPLLSSSWPRCLLQPRRGER